MQDITHRDVYEDREWHGTPLARASRRTSGSCRWHGRSPRTSELAWKCSKNIALCHSRGRCNARTH